MVIGGYLGLEISKKQPFHQGATYLNSGRNCLEIIIKKKAWKIVQVPFFTCSAVTDVLKRNGCRIVYYNINRYFEIQDFTEIDYNLPIILNNYFGIKREYIKKMVGIFRKAIVDNSQDFFDQTPYDVPVFFSPRKYFGVPDGGILKIPGSSNEEICHQLSQDVSHGRMSHLLKSLDLDIESAYQDYLANEEIIGSLEPMRMSNLTYKLLLGVDYQMVEEKRSQNFKLLNEKLRQFNAFVLPVESGLFSYPFISPKKGLRNFLISNKVFTPLLWPNVLDDSPAGSVARELSEDVVHLPVDQRFGEKEMNEMSEMIISYINNG